MLEQHPHTSGIVEHYFRDKRLLNDIFSTLATKMLLYEPIAGCWDAANERISLQTWSTEEMILILGNTEISRFAIDNINRCIFKRASDLILSKPERTSERSWFYIDEVSEAGQLPISSLLKKGRSKGGRVAVAFQSISGLRDPKLFGQHVTDDRVSLLNIISWNFSNAAVRSVPRLCCLPSVEKYQLFVCLRKYGLGCCGLV